MRGEGWWKKCPKFIFGLVLCTVPGWCSCLFAAIQVSLNMLKSLGAGEYRMELTLGRV